MGCRTRAPPADRDPTPEETVGARTARTGDRHPGGSRLRTHPWSAGRRMTRPATPVGPELGGAAAESVGESAGESVGESVGGSLGLRTRLRMRTRLRAAGPTGRRSGRRVGGWLPPAPTRDCPRPRPSPRGGCPRSRRPGCRGRRWVRRRTRLLRAVLPAGPHGGRRGWAGPGWATWPRRPPPPGGRCRRRCAGLYGSWTPTRDPRRPGSLEIAPRTPCHTLRTCRMNRRRP